MQGYWEESQEGVGDRGLDGAMGGMWSATLFTRDRRKGFIELWIVRPRKMIK